MRTLQRLRIAAGTVILAGLALPTASVAQDLALTLRAGSLPTPLTIVAQRELGPSLGEDSIRGGITAGVVGTTRGRVTSVGSGGRGGSLGCNGRTGTNVSGCSTGGTCTVIGAKSSSSATPLIAIAPASAD